MMIIIIPILVAICFISWGVIVHLGRSQALSLKSIENLNGDLYLIHLTKPNDMRWKAGSYAKITLPEVKEGGQKSRWLTIASKPDENEILILTHNSGSSYKKILTSLPVGSKVEINWLDSHLSVTDGEEALVCFASDVGIAAIRPIIKEWVGKRDIIFSHLDKGVTAFNAEITNLSNEATNLTYETSTSSSQSQETLKKAADKYGNKATYLLAGQPDDVEVMKKVLEKKGVDNKQIKVDNFNGLK